MIRYLFRVSLKMLNNHKSLLILSFLQFTVLFMFILILSALIYENTLKKDILQDKFGNEFWTIDANIKNPQELLNNPEWPTGWNDEQIEYITETFPNRVGYSYVDLISQTYNTENIVNLWVSENIFDIIADATDHEDAEYFYTDRNNAAYKQLNTGEKIIDLNPEYKIDYTLLDPLLGGYDSSDYIILKSEELPTVTPEITFLLYLIDVKASELSEHNIFNELGYLNEYYAYSVDRSIRYGEEKIDTQMAMNELALVFSTLSLFIIFVGVIGFILVQYNRNKHKFTMYKVLGAENKHLYSLFIIWYLLILGPAYITSIVLFIFFNLFIYKLYGFVFSIIVLTVLMLLLIILALLPLIYHTKKLDLIKELGVSNL